MKRKLCIVTGTRAEYGLLYPLISRIHKDPKLELQLIATGMHLSPEFGLTYRQIEEDGFTISKKIEALLSSDTPTAISKSMGLTQISFSDAFSELNPDIIVVLGDRFEIFAVASTALLQCIPIAHIHGGELTLGATDNAIRHAITKMSHFHFASTETYRQRIIQLGEPPNTVFNVGSLGVENSHQLSLLDRSELEESLGMPFEKKNLLITFHPVTLDLCSSQEQFQELLNALTPLQDTRLIFTKCNSDTDGRIINQMIDYYTQNHANAIGFTSLGQQRYLSCLKYVDAVIGNSSSGIIEAPSFKIATINIGDRQTGRIQAQQTINCLPKQADISQAIEQVYSDTFQQHIRHTKNPYEQENTCKSIKNILQSASLKNILKKQFYDLPIKDTSIE